MKFVSIMGDSISTFQGYNPPGYAVFYNKEMQMKNGLNTVYDTWWAKVNQSLHAYLCINGSYSGSRVTGTAFPAGASEKRINDLECPGIAPDIILVYLGINDFGYGVSVKKNLIASRQTLDLLVFEDAYNIMLKKMTRKYPNAKIICGTLMRSCLANHEDWLFPEAISGTKLEKYNDAIRSAARANHCCLADIAAQNTLKEVRNSKR